jgi:hypothetical protein
MLHELGKQINFFEFTNVNSKIGNYSYFDISKSEKRKSFQIIPTLHNIRYFLRKKIC